MRLSDSDEGCVFASKESIHVMTAAALEEASSERTAVMTILWPAHRFWYGWKM